MDWSVGANNKMYTDLDIKKSKMSSSFQREMELRFVNKQGNTFLNSWIEKAKSFDYDPDLIPPQTSRIIACDPAWGSSAFGVVVTDFRDGKVCVLHADEYPNETAENMVDLVSDLYYKYAPVAKIFVDGSQISFIKSLKIALYNELREETDYQQQIKRYKDNNCDYTLNMKILPVTFTADSSKAMLSYVRSLLEEGYIMIHPRFEKLLLAFHTCVDKEGRVDKTGISHSDVFDACRMGLEAYTFS